MREAPIMNIGSTVDKESATTIVDSLIKILEAKADQESIRHALDVFSSAFKVEQIVIQNCHITGDDDSVTVKVEVEPGKKVNVENAARAASY